MLQQVDYSASWPIHDFDWRWVGLAYFQDTTADIYMDLKLLSERLHYRSSTSFVFVLFLSLPIYRERTIIGLVSYLYRYWQYRIGYCCIGRYYVHHCRFINCWRVALHTMIKGCSSTRHPPAACARVRAVLWSMIQERVGGKGGGRRLCHGEAGIRLQRRRSTGLGHHHAALPPPAGSDNNSPLSNTLMFLRINQS